jgi:Rrf2 family protein
MTNALKISEAASLALHVMVLLAEREADGPLTTHQAAERLGVSEAHLSKVMQRLSHAGFVRSRRGPGGGFELGRPPEEVCLLDVYEAIEGRLGPTECLLGRPACNGTGCVLGDLLTEIDQLVRRRLAGTKLSEVAGVFAGKEQS